MGLLFTEQWDKFHEPSFAKRRQDRVGLPRAPPGRGRMTMGSRSIPSPLGCSAMLRAAALAAVLPLAACSNAGVLDPQGPIAEAERLLLVNSTAIMLVVVVPVVLATLGFAWWYRASNPRATQPGAGVRGADRVCDLVDTGTRLEMAVHLSRPGRRRSQSTGGTHGNSAPVPPHLGNGDELVFCAAARQPDLRDVGDDDAPEPARRSAGRISRHLG